MCLKTLNQCLAPSQVLLKKSGMLHKLLHKKWFLEERLSQPHTLELCMKFLFWAGGVHFTFIIFCNKLRHLNYFPPNFLSFPWLLLMFWWQNLLLWKTNGNIANRTKPWKNIEQNILYSFIFHCFCTRCFISHFPPSHLMGWLVGEISDTVVSLSICSAE